jgi:hypothetical protein
MRPARANVASPPERPEHPTLAPSVAPTAITPGEEAAAFALASLDYGEAPRIGVLGDSGTGKTFAVRKLIAIYLQRSPGLPLIIDTKKPDPQFAGQIRRNPDELEKLPVDEKGIRSVVFRGDQSTFERTLDPEVVARYAWKMSRTRWPCVIVYDELKNAANNGQWKAGKESAIAWAFTQGRDVGVASIWGTQETEFVPPEAFNQSSCLLVFRLAGNPIRLLKARNYLVGDGNLEKVIPTLKGEPLPPKERGTFVLLRRGQPWDGKIYKFHE